MECIVQHRNKLIAAFIITLLALGLYEHFDRHIKFERAMLKEAEYVVNMQAREIESLKQQLAERPPACAPK